MSAGYECITKEVNIVPLKLSDNLKIIDKYIIAVNVLDDIGEMIHSNLCLVEQYESGIIDFNIFRESMIKSCSSSLDIIINTKIKEEQGDYIFDRLVEGCESINDILQKLNKQDNRLQLLVFEEIIQMVYSYKDLIESFNRTVKAES